MLLPLVLAITNRQCRNACREEYNLSGRVAIEHEKGEYGFNADVDCTCPGGWTEKSNERSCNNYCRSKKNIYPFRFCHYVSPMCILYVGLVY